MTKTNKKKEIRECILFAFENAGKGTIFSGKKKNSP